MPIAARCSAWLGDTVDDRSCLWRVALMTGKFMRTFHPWNSFQDLYVSWRGKCLGMIISCTLYIHNARKRLVVVVEKTCAAVLAKVATAVWG